ncbi:hypothetical protein ACFSJY_07335 [Thalassotalea euphylliae]|uniref:hypothetical protein n=1 Tax=Thalassotalea euphylliae TaxID=1655234 RepID=UPI00362A2544
MSNKLWLLISLILVVIIVWQKSFISSMPLQTFMEESTVLQKQGDTPNVPEAMLTAPINHSMLDEAKEPKNLQTNQQTVTQQCAFPEFSDEERDKHYATIDSFIQELLSSPDVIQQRFAYLFASNKLKEVSPHHKRLFLSAYLEQAPNDKLAVQALLDVCFNLPNDDDCGEDISQFIESADNENGVLWLQHAANMLKQEKLHAFDQFFTIAASKQNFDEYFFDTIQTFLNNTVGYVDSSFNQLAITATGYAAARPLLFANVMELCRNDDKYKEQCFNVFDAMRKYGSSVNLKSMGSGMLQDHYKDEKDTEAVNALVIESQLLYDKLYSQDFINTQALFTHDQELMRTWLETGKQFGEEAATVAMLEEAKLKSLNPDYNPCPESP